MDNSETLFVSEKDRGVPISMNFVTQLCSVSIVRVSSSCDDFCKIRVVSSAKAKTFPLAG